MESQLVEGCEHFKSDKQSTISIWLDQLSPARYEESIAIVDAHSPSRSLSSADIQVLESCLCASCLHPHVETGPELTRCSRKRKRHWPEGGMDDSDAISVGSSSRIMANRPILEPTPPSTRRTPRTPSPTRKLLTMLEAARPPLKCCQPGNAVGALPDRVVALRRYLAKGLGKGCIPRDLKLRLREAAADEVEDMDDAMFGDTFIATENLDAYWEKVKGVYTEAERCHNSHKDENAWVEIVRAVFRAAGLTSPSSALEVNSVQTQQISPDLLPVLPNSVTPIAKKADLALAFPAHDPQVREVLQTVSAARPGTSFSHMTDAYTSTVPLVCGIEVKEPGGDYNEAIMQLGIWSAAGLEKVRGLGGRTADGTAAGEPFLGWTVVGHEWRLHIAWKEPRGRVVIMGPWSSMKAGTASYVELFTLLDLVKRVGAWLREVYWLWLREEMLRPIGK